MYLNLRLASVDESVRRFRIRVKIRRGKDRDTERDKTRERMPVRTARELHLATGKFEIRATMVIVAPSSVAARKEGLRNMDFVYLRNGHQPMLNQRRFYIDRRIISH